MWRVDQSEAAGGRRADHATVARPGGATGDREGAERFLPADRSISFVWGGSASFTGHDSGASRVRQDARRTFRNGGIQKDQVAYVLYGICL